MGWFFKSEAEKEADRRIASQEESKRAAEREAEVQRIVDKKTGRSSPPSYYESPNQDLIVEPSLPKD